MLHAVLASLMLAGLPTKPDAPAKAKPGEELKQAVADFAQNVEQATRLIAQHHVKEFAHGRLVAWAIEGLYGSVGERLPEDLTRAVNEARDGRQANSVALLTESRQRLGRRKELLEHRDIDAALEAVFRHVEPGAKHQKDAREEDNWRDTWESSRGIGVRLRAGGPGGYVQVVTPIKDGPAYLGGVLAGDLITRVRNLGRWGGANDDTDTKGLSADDVQNLLQGRSRSRVTLTIAREGMPQPFEITLQRSRDSIERETVLGHERRLDDSWDFLLDPKLKIAYLRVVQFGVNTNRDVKRALEELTGAGMRGLVLDLRFSPGGYLDGAVDFADLFLETGLITAARGRGKESRFEAEKGNDYLDFPIVCLINRDTSGTAELIAAALQDHGRAVILGERSRGQAEVSNLYRLNHGLIRFTTALFVRPSGKNLSRIMSADSGDWGIVPDEPVRLSPKLYAELREHLDAHDILSPPDRPRQQKPFRDLQQELAVSRLRQRLAGK